MSGLKTPALMYVWSQVCSLAFLHKLQMRFFLTSVGNLYKFVQPQLYIFVLWTPCFSLTVYIFIQIAMKFYTIAYKIAELSYEIKLKDQNLRVRTIHFKSADFIQNKLR